MLALAKAGDPGVKGVAVARLSTDPHTYLVLTDGDGDGSQAITLEEGEFEPVPEYRPQVASRVHVAGPSGVGKSTWAGKYGQAFKQATTGGRVIVISADGNDDPALPCDARVPVDESFADVDLETLVGADKTPTLVVFDDIEGLPPAKAKAVQVFEQAVAERGRKLGVTSCAIFHRGANGAATRTSLSEATAFVVFPGAMSSNTDYLLKRYAGVEPEILTLIRRQRWGNWLLILPGRALISPTKAVVMDGAVLGSIARAEKKRLAKEATAAAQGRATEGATALFKAWKGLAEE